MTYSEKYSNVSSNFVDRIVVSTLLTDYSFVSGLLAMIFLC